MNMMSRVRGSGVAIVVFAAMTLAAPVQAGFFDSFLGGQSQPLFGFSRPSTGYGYGGPERPYYRQYRTHHVSRGPVEEKPMTRQEATDLMHDPTLRYGDAVMMKTGIAIYTGGRTASHDPEDFSPLHDVKRLKSSEKIALEAVDAARPDLLPGAKSSSQLVSGRSSVSAVALVKGVMINDQNGKSIRYVGP